MLFLGILWDFICIFFETIGILIESCLIVFSPFIALVIVGIILLTPLLLIVRAIFRRR